MLRYTVYTTHALPPPPPPPQWLTLTEQLVQVNSPYIPFKIGCTSSLDNNVFNNVLLLTPNLQLCTFEASSTYGY